MFSLRRNFRPTTFERMQSDGNNLHEMWKKGALREMLPNKRGWKIRKK